jgi:hypothetical protein
VQLDGRFERNEALGDADRMVAGEMGRVEVNLDQGEGLEPEDAAVVGANVATEVIRSHVIAQHRIIERLHRAHGAFRVVPHVELEVGRSEGGNLRWKRPIRPLADLANAKCMVSFDVPREVPVLREGLLAHGACEEEVGVELSQDAILPVVNVEIRLVSIWFEQLDIVVRRSNRVGDNRIAGERALAEWADVLVIARCHRHEAAKARATVATWKKNNVGDWLQAQQAVGTRHPTRVGGPQKLIGVKGKMVVSRTGLMEGLLSWYVMTQPYALVVNRHEGAAC